jgi:hypothetical protein
MSDYKKIWEKSLAERNQELESLKSENARLREALLKISVPDPVSYDGIMAYSYKLIAREALKGKE